MICCLHACGMYVDVCGCMGFLNILFALQHKLDAQCVRAAKCHLNAAQLSCAAGCPLPSDCLEWLRSLCCCNYDYFLFIYSFLMCVCCVCMIIPGWFCFSHPQWHPWRGFLVLAHTCTVACTVAHRHNMDKHGKQADAWGVAPVGAQQGDAQKYRHAYSQMCLTYTHAHTHAIALIFILLFLHTLPISCTHTHHLCSLSAVPTGSGLYCPAVSRWWICKTPRQDEPPSLTLSPLSSTVVIEDENGDDEALKNGTEKTPAEA